MSVSMTMPILIVDDYNTMIRIMRNLLRQLGFTNIDEATDGTMAWEMVKKKQYGLIVSDWNMEPMTGFELLPAGAASSVVASPDMDCDCPVS